MVGISATSHAPGDLTALLGELGPGEARAADILLPAVYQELRAMAQSLLQQERHDHTLQATALVHEAYLKLVNQDEARWQSRAHFFAVAAQAMRRILVDHARGRKRRKRGCGERPLLLSDICSLSLERDVTLLALDEALQQLAESDPLGARIVEMRYFAGLRVDEIAFVLDVTTKTVQRRWNYAKAWLYRALTLQETADTPSAGS